MMEVVAEPAWDQFKEEVEIMEEHGGGGAGELLTREMKKRLLDHAHENGNGTHGHFNGDVGEEAPEEAEEEAPEELKVPEEEEQSKSISFDPAKGLWKCRHCDWTYRLASPCKIGILNLQGYRDQIERNLEWFVQKEPFYGSLNRVPGIITDVEDETDETPSPKGEDLEAHGNGSAQETSGSHSNGSHQVFNGVEHGMPYMLRMDKTEIFPTEVNRELVFEAQPEENGSHSNGSHQVSNVSDTEIPYMLRVDNTVIFPTEINKELVFEVQPEENGSHSDGSHQVSDGAEAEIAYKLRVDKTEIFQAEVAKDEHVTEAQPEIEEYDLEKILDKQETHDLYCPNCKSCITRRVILRKRKRTARLTTHDDPPKRPHTEEVPSAPLPERDEQESPEVFRCLSCFSFFIPTGCSFNIFRIFGRRDQQVDVVLPPPATEDMHQSENCTSWLLSCFQPGDSPNQAATDSLQTPLLQGTPTSGDTTTTTTKTSASYVHSHDTVVKPEQSTDESSSTKQTTTTTTTTTTTKSGTATTSSTTTSAAASTSSHTSSAMGIFPNDVMEVITGEMPHGKPAGGALMGTTHHQIGHEDVQGPATPSSENGSLSSHATHTSGFKFDSSNVTNTVAGIISRGDIPISPSPEAAGTRPHVAVSVPEDVNPIPQQKEDWDILKAIVYGGLVELITSLSLVSAAASSGAKTLDIFILGIANLIGGLPLIFHNIADLRDIEDVDGNDEQVGHYWLNLGRRSKAQLHMVTALLSYIIFGLLPPVLYGLSFYESNNRENKIMAVAAASLTCIALLALGKAHVSRHRTYFKKLMYYLTIAVSCSGLSYVAGMLITRILASYGIADGGGASGAPAPPGLMFPDVVGAETSAWASF